MGSVEHKRERIWDFEDKGIKISQTEMQRQK